MLMHVEHWDGRTIYNFKEKDIPNIRKLLTHKWVTHPDNETNWRDKLKLGQVRGNKNLQFSMMHKAFMYEKESNYDVHCGCLMVTNK